MKPHSRYLAVCAAALLPIFSASLSWGWVRVPAVDLQGRLPAAETAGITIRSAERIVPLNAWNSTSPFFGLEIPNWAVAAEGAALVILAALGWLRLHPLWLPLALLALAGALQCGVYAYAILTKDGMGAGGAPFLGVAGFGLVLALLPGLRPRPAPA